VSLFFRLFTFTINLCPHWRKRWDSSHLEKPKYHHISAVVWPISTIFGTATQFGPLEPSDH